MRTNYVDNVVAVKKNYQGAIGYWRSKEVKEQ